MRFKRIYVEIGNMCNMHCLFCSNDSVKKRQMTLEEFKIVLSKIKDYTDYIYLHIKGEPLFHKDFLAILEECNKAKINVNLTTNATLLPEFSDVLLNSPCVRQVNISAHALPYVLSKDKEKYLDGISRFILDNQVDKKIYIQLRLWIKDDEVNNYIFSYLGEKLGKVLDYNKKKIMDKTFLSFDEEFTWPSLNNDFVSDDGKCKGTFTHIGILASGDIVPCCLDSSGAEVLGNIFKDDLSDVINSEKFKAIHNGFKEGKVESALCKRCSYRKRFD